MDYFILGDEQNKSSRLFLWKTNLSFEKILKVLAEAKH
jgi:hypothetical protein